MNVHIYILYSTLSFECCRVENARDDTAYSFNGEGYAARNRVSSGPYNKYSFGVSISFRTYDENALLFLAINPENVCNISNFVACSRHRQILYEIRRCNSRLSIVSLQ